MLSEWLAPTPVGDFVGQALRRAPWAMAGTAAAARARFDWATLDRVLAAAPPRDVLVVARGDLVDVPVPTSLAALRPLMARGIGLNIRRGERHDPGLAALAAAFAADLPGEVHVQLFVTPGGTHGFGWHYDHEDVFIVQTAGIKDYYFRPNTVDLTARGGTPDFARFRAETSPLATARLEPGDFLYIPSRWWHMARCHEDALSISLGVFPRGTD